MHIINLTYTTSLDEIDKHLENHVVFLNKQYELGNFLTSGRKVPRTGGIILSNVSNKNKLLEIIGQDPFKKHGLAEYELIEFVPSKSSPELAFLID